MDEIKTNAMRMLDAKQVPYTTHRFPDDVHSAEDVAEAVGVPGEMVFKTLVVVSASQSDQAYLAMVPAHCQLDLKKLARVAREKKLKMAGHDQAEEMTGLQVGGISALALLNRGFRVFLDASAQRFPEILVSAGQRGINLQLPVSDLVRIVKARIADIARLL